MPFFRYRIHWKAVLIAALAALSVGLWYLNAPPPSSPVLAVNTPERVVLDLIEAPGPVRATYAGTALELPGQPTRWLAVELHNGIASVGWAESPEQQPLVTVALPDTGVRVIAYPLSHPAVAGVEVMPGLRSADGRPALQIVEVE